MFNILFKNGIEFLKINLCDIYFYFQAQAFKRFIPMFDRVLVERFAPEVKTKGGILIPEKAQGKVIEATVVAVGSGARTDVSK